MLTNSDGRKTGRSGFTLIELMTVLAIIAVLTLIGLPEYTKYKQRVYDTTALSDITQFRNAVINELSPSSFFGFETGPAVHSAFGDVAISPNVKIFDVSQDFLGGGGGYVFYAYSCHTSGSAGYLIIVPYGQFNPFSAFFRANQIYENPAYRWNCP